MSRTEPHRIAPPHRALLWLAPWLLSGCEAIADLDQLHVERDAGSSAEDAGREPVEPFDGGSDPYPELRALCVEVINDQRASLSLPPLAPGSALQADCADRGAREDAELDSPHHAAQNRSAECARVGFGPENSCPNWRYGPGMESDALRRCIQQMWDEGMPPVSDAECRADLAADGCFSRHGHWLNLASTRSKVVACGFALLEDDGIWINLDFAAR